MRAADIENLDIVVKQCIDERIVQTCGRALLLCPSSEEIEMATRRLPSWNFDVLDRRSWDLMNAPNQHLLKYDAAFMCNMFMYSKDPILWFHNLSQRIDLLFVQDSVRCGRMPNTELGDDGDSCRYSFSKSLEFARVAESLDIDSCFSDNGPKILKRRFYSDTGSPDGRDCRKFIALFDLANK